MANGVRTPWIYTVDYDCISLGTFSLRTHTDEYWIVLSVVHCHNSAFGTCITVSRVVITWISGGGWGGGVCLAVCITFILISDNHNTNPICLRYTCTLYIHRVHHNTVCHELARARFDQTHVHPRVLVEFDYLTIERSNKSDIVSNLAKRGTSTISCEWIGFYNSSTWP
jgi:hypothetical protein